MGREVCGHALLSENLELYKLFHLEISLQRYLFRDIFFLKVQSRVVRKVDNAIHRINHYPVDTVVCFVNTYPLDSVLSGG